MDRYIYFFYIYIYIIFVYADIYVCVHPHPDQETGGRTWPSRSAWCRTTIAIGGPTPAPSQQAKRAELAGTTSCTNCPPAKKKARARHNQPKLAYEWWVIKGSLEIKLPTYGKMQPDREREKEERREKRERASEEGRSEKERFKIQEKATPMARNLQNLLHLLFPPARWRLLGFIRVLLLLLPPPPPPRPHWGQNS